ncbi:hypothetical protein V9N52_004249 [Vibrio navarrensis]
MDNEMNTVQIPAEKLVDALLHAKQFEHHYATQESVDNLKESVRELKADTNKRFDEMKSDTAKQFESMKSDTAKQFESMKSDTAKQFDELKSEFKQQSTKSDRFQWFIMALIIGTFFKDQVFSLFM